MHLGRELAQPEHTESLYLQPPPLAPVGGGLVVPTGEHFALIRSEARAAGTLKDLRQLAAAWEEVAKKCNLAFEELFRLAVFRLEVERDLGAQLAQTVKPGPHGKQSSRVINSGLPDAISPNQSAAYQKLAAIPEDVFRGYIESSRQARRTPSSRGACAFTGPVGSKVRRVPRSKKARAGDVTLSPKLIEACMRCLGDIDVLVGKAKVKAATSVADLEDVTKATRGSMLVVGPLDPAKTLRCVAELRGSGRIEEAIVALPRDIDAGWWSSLITGPWSLCVPNERGAAILAHIGGHAHAFALVFATLGVVADVKVRLGGDVRT